MRKSPKNRQKSVQGGCTKYRANRACWLTGSKFWLVQYGSSGSKKVVFCPFRVGVQGGVQIWGQIWVHFRLMTFHMPSLCFFVFLWFFRKFLLGSSEVLLFCSKFVSFIVVLLCLLVFLDFIWFLWILGGLEIAC